MNTPLDQKSSVDEIRGRFDDDVDRFSDLNGAQQSVVDAAVMMDLITRAALASTRPIRTVLDVGAGAGNNTLKLLQQVSPLDCDLVDLSGAMLARAAERIGRANPGTVRTFQADIRAVDLPENRYDVIIAAAVLHHLREDHDWEAVFGKLYSLTAPGGSLWITDLVSHEDAGVQQMMWADYGNYLEGLGGAGYRQHVFAYIDREDSPRPVTYQLDLLRRAGFCQVDLLHKHSCFAAFGGRKCP